jgi:hypothetical protein
MSELYDEIVNNRGTLRNWMDRVPGLGGYLDKKDRRAADRLIREHVAGQLDQRLDRFTEIEKRILKSGGMSLMSDTREAKEKFQTYISKVKAAAPGYSGFFAAVKVDEEAMDRLYAFDEAQLRYLDQIDAKLDALDTAVDQGEGIEVAIRDVYSLAQEATQAFSLREDVLTQLNETYS